MPRMMKDDAFRAEQYALLHEPHIAPITALVDELRSDDDHWLPYVAPMHGGIHARILTILRDPGPATRESEGSGMLSLENNDQTAANQYQLAEMAGLKHSDLIPWNAYPWYINRAPIKDEIQKATPVLVRLLNLLPDLEVVLLQGREAQVAWQAVLEVESAIRRRRLITIETLHPSNQALQTSSPEERQRRIDHRIQAWNEAASYINQ